MRELKFRAWSKRRNKWIYDCEIGFCVRNGVSVPYWNSDDVIVEQYTGLKDKNGKEIYEGDIVKLGEDSYEVLFDSYGQFCIENKKLHWTKDCFSFNSVDVWNSKRDGLLVEVIGNIHENPELLEEEG